MQTKEEKIKKNKKKELDKNLKCKMLKEIIKKEKNSKNKKKYKWNRNSGR